MELALTIIAGIGALLFVFAYLGYVIAGFKHHFITGIISALPILNIVTIPALWYKTSKKILLSILGIIIVGASWFLGADKGINNTIALLKGKPKQNTVVLTNPSQNATNRSSILVTTPQINQQTASKPYASKQRFINDNNLAPLPGKALYHMQFEVIPLKNIGTLQGRTIQITTNSHETYEGRVTKITNSSIVIQSKSTEANELPIANIKQLRLMVKKAN